MTNLPSVGCNTLFSGICWGLAEPDCAQLGDLVWCMCLPSFSRTIGWPDISSGNSKGQESKPKLTDAFQISPASHLLVSQWSEQTSQLNLQSREGKKVNFFFFFFWPHSQHAEVPGARDQIHAMAVTTLDL